MSTTIQGISLKMGINGSMYRLDPKPDITPLESIMLAQLITIATRIHTTANARDAYISEHNLWRHFSPAGNQGDI